MQTIITVLIIVGFGLVLLVEYAIKRLENSNINIGADPTKQPTVDVATMATQFASVRAQIENTEGETAAETFVSSYANCIFKAPAK